VILEDNVRDINKFLRAREELNSLFNNRIHLGKYTTDDLLGFAFDYIKPLAEKADLIMCDLKLMDEAAHKANTGVSNVNILKNIKLLDSLGIPVIVRTPLIPGVTDGADNLGGIAAFLGDMKNLVRYEVLNFNPLGEGKYKSLSANNPYESARPLGETRLAEIRALLDGVGISYKIV
jgi:pyruvate formate lyase activating enzyme